MTWPEYRPPETRNEPTDEPSWPRYLPPPCPDCATQELQIFGGAAIRHIVTDPCDAHREPEDET